MSNNFDINNFDINNFDINNLNSFIDQASETIACGSECQNQKKAEELKTKYLDTESNLYLAQPQYQQAKQNYYTYVFGQAGYDEMMEEEYNEQSIDIKNQFKNKYNTEIDKINTQLDTYDSLLINLKNVYDYREQYIKENKDLFEQIKYEENDIITNERKTYYEEQEIDSLIYYYYILFVIYIIVVICFGIFSFYYPSQTSFKIRLLILGVFIILPFISTFILGKIIQIVYWLFGLLPNNVYK